MISDVLFEAVEDIDSYLTNPIYNKMYSGALREEILALRNAMAAMVGKLDTPPTLSELSNPSGQDLP